MSRPDQPQLVARDFLGLGTKNNSSLPTSNTGPSKEMAINAVTLTPQQLQQLSRKQYSDAIAAVKSNIMEGVQGPPAWPMYANNMAFQGLGQTEWNNGVMRRQVLPKGERVDENNIIVQNAGYANGLISIPNQDHLISNFMTDNSGNVVKKVFPFLSPVNHAQPMQARVQQIQVANDPRISSQVITPTPLFSAHATNGSTTNTPARVQSPQNDKQSTTQLTIFYGGSVNVYNNVSLAKAQEIMMMAATGSSLPSPTPSAPPSPFARSYVNGEERADHVVADQGSPNTVKQPENALPNIPESEVAVPRALPQARKASLARFLERRKERVQSRAPYLTRKPSFEESGSNFPISTPITPSSNDCAGQRLMSIA